MKNTILFKCMILVFVLIAIQVNAQWEYMESMPTPRHSSTACEFNGKIYVIGGHESFYASPLSTVEVYDPVTNTWDTTVADLPVPISGASSIVANGKIFVFGNEYPSVEPAFSFDPITGLWEIKNEIALGLSQFSSSILNEEVYAVGGYGFFSSSDNFSSYNFTNNSWTTHADMPSPRGDLTSEVLDGRLYAMGGGGPDISFSTMEVYDPSIGWIIGDDMPGSKAGHGSGVLKDTIYVFGGRTSGGSSPGTWKYHPSEGWEDLENDMPEDINRFAYAVAKDENNRKCIYTFGGRSSDQVSGSVLKYCPPQVSEWELLDQTLPEAVALNTATMLDGKIYIIGGLNHPHWDSIATNKVRVFDADQEIWLPDAPDFPSPVCGATSEVIDNKIYVIGGAPSNWTRSNSLYEYSPTGGGSWVKKADMLTSRFFHTSAVLNDKIYVMGGRHVEDISLPVEKSVEMYDPNLNTWTQVADMNAPRALFSAEVVNGKLYVMGGAQSSDSSNHTMEVYDPQSNTWTLLGDMPSERVFHGSAVINDAIYVFGGHTENYERKTWKSDNLETGTWIELENTSIPETIGWFADATVDGSGLTCTYAFGGGYANFYFYIIDNSLPPPYVTNTVYKLCFPSIVSTTNPGKASGEPGQIHIYPNPLSSKTTIKYELENSDKVCIKVYNIAGQEVKTLIDGYQLSGTHEIEWDASVLTDGLYLFKLQTGRYVVTKKCILQRF